MSAASFPSANINLRLPIEFTHALNQTYFLHLLATDPAKVLPPGKSMLSVMSGQHTSSVQKSEPTAHNTLQDKVERLVHRAFWDEALESLSNPQPSSQLLRLEHLYKDLLQALEPLFPPHHSILTILSSPLSPTSSPLLTALTHLRTILHSLRERCAPARDGYIDELLTSLDDPSPLANVIVNTIKAILELSAAMKNDLSQFVIGQMTERQLRSLVVQQAREREQEVVIGLWGEEGVHTNWERWVTESTVTGRGQGTARDRWIVRLLQALGSSLPVSCNLPSSASNTANYNSNILDLNLQSQHECEQAVHQNTLPPPFLFSTPSLLYIQNFLQSLIVAASLRSLVHLPHTSPGHNTKSPAEDFMKRIWTLLKAEIDKYDSQVSVPGESATKLVNLADEVVRARSAALDSELQSAEEASLRSAVERTLQYHDPVFLLLQKRLMSVLAERLIHPPGSSTSQSNATIGAPAHMRTGRDASKPNVKLSFDQFNFDTGVHDRHMERVVLVKGFEDPVLVEGIGEVLGRIRACIAWVEVVWRAFIEGSAEALVEST